MNSPITDQHFPQPTHDDIEWVKHIVAGRTSHIPVPGGFIDIDKERKTYFLRLVGPDSPMMITIVTCLRGLGWKRENAEAYGRSPVKPLVGDVVKLGDRRLIEDRFPGEVIALHANGSIRVRLEDGRELDGWPERTRPIPNDRTMAPQ